MKGTETNFETPAEKIIIGDCFEIIKHRIQHKFSHISARTNFMLKSNN